MKFSRSRYPFEVSTLMMCVFPALLLFQKISPSVGMQFLGVFPAIILWVALLPSIERISSKLAPSTVPGATGFWLANLSNMVFFVLFDVLRRRPSWGHFLMTLSIAAAFDLLEIYLRRIIFSRANEAKLRPSIQA